MNLEVRVSRWAQQGVVWLLLATVLIVPFLFSPNADLGAWQGVKPVVFELMVIALLALALVSAAVPGSRERLVRFLRVGPNQAILMLVLYGAASWYRSTAPGFSGAEWMRLAGGAGLYFVVAATLRQRGQVQRLIDVLIAAVILASLYGLVSYGETDQSSMSSSFGNGQLFAGFLMILLPLLIALSFGEPEGRRRLAAQAATALALPGLLLSQNRSSWIGVVVALLVMGMLVWRAYLRKQIGRHLPQMVVPLVVMIGAVGLFLVVSRSGPLVRARAATLAKAPRDASLAWRLQMWKGGWQLIRERPLFGWGIGTFPLEQARTVPFSIPREVVARMGPSLQEEAHNEYVQTAAEMGLVGLLLSVWVLGAYFAHALNRVRGHEFGWRQLVLIGCTAGLAGQAVDALSNPAWRFADVSFMFWLVMGLGVAVSRLPRRGADAPLSAGAAASLPPPRLTWQGATLALGVLAMGGAWAQFASGTTDRDGCPLPQYRDKLSYTVYDAVTTSQSPPPPSAFHPATGVITLTSGQCVWFEIFATCTDKSICTGMNQIPNGCLKSFVEPGEGPCLTNQMQGNSLGPFCANCGVKRCQGTGEADAITFSYKDSGRKDSIASADVRVSCSTGSKSEKDENDSSSGHGSHGD